MDAVYSVIDSLQSNPDETPVGKAIAAAEHKLDNGEENWAAIMSACDLVNSTENGPRDAVRAIRRHLQARQNWSTVSTMISIIEALSKNCGRRFHLQLTNRAFLREIRLILTDSQSGTTPEQVMPADLQKRILAMIQCWAYVFRTEKQFKAIKDLYSELLSRDFEFPDVRSSISMMPAQALDAENDNRHQRNEDDAAHQKMFDSLKTKAMNFIKGPLFTNNGASAIASTDQTEFRAGTFLNSHQIAKLRSEISVVCEHVNILNQIIESFHPESLDQDASSKSTGEEVKTGGEVVYRKRDLDLMDRLYEVCGEMHSRILDVIGLVDEELLAQMLSLIDEMNNVFARYLDFRREHPKTDNDEPIQQPEKETAKQSKDVRPHPLLDLS